MIVDTSAILAIAFKEREADRFTNALSAASVKLMCAVNWFEALMVAEARNGPRGSDDVLELLDSFWIEEVPFDGKCAMHAQQAWRRYGKGRHPAALNMADCCAYATAIIRNEPLLYKGEDFAKTDIVAAPW